MSRVSEKGIQWWLRTTRWTTSLTLPRGLRKRRKGDGGASGSFLPCRVCSSRDKDLEELWGDEMCCEAQKHWLQISVKIRSKRKSKVQTFLQSGVGERRRLTKLPGVSVGLKLPAGFYSLTHWKSTQASLDSLLQKCSLEKELVKEQ